MVRSVDTSPFGDEPSGAIALTDLVDELPNYRQCEGSPEFLPEEAGIRVAFGPAIRQEGGRPGQLAQLHGSYALGNAEMRSMAINPLSRITISVTEKRSGKVSVLPLLQGARSLAAAKVGKTAFDPTPLARGFFNIDLREACLGVGGPGHYWVVFQLGLHLSSMLDVQVRETAASGLARSATVISVSGIGTTGEFAYEDDEDEDAFGEDDDPTRIDQELHSRIVDGTDALRSAETQPMVDEGDDESPG
jgi:hypothetical protein